MKAWQPGCLVCDEVDEYYEPTDKDGRRLAARIKLIINLAAHRATLTQRNEQAARQPLPNSNQ